jgi:hypothetical protein
MGGGVVGGMCVCVVRVRWEPHRFSGWSLSRREAIVGDALTKASALCVGLGVGGAAVASGSHVHPSNSCDGWVCDLGLGLEGQT